MKNNSIDPSLVRPFPLSDFPGIPFEYLELLKSKGILNTKELYDLVHLEQQQQDLSSSTGIPVYRLKELFCLCDLSRITGVDGIFARVLYEAGIRSTAEFACADATTMLRRCQGLIKKHGYAAGKLVKEDMSDRINYASILLTCDNKADKK